MLELTFQNQIKRLQNRWPRTYETELVAILWRAFKEIPDDLFIEATDHCIGNMRQAPMFQDLDEAVARAKSRKWESQARTGDGNISRIMEDAQRLNHKADPDFVAACVKTLNERLSGAITASQFKEGCRLLEQAANELNPKIKAPSEGTDRRSHAITKGDYQ